MSCVIVVMLHLVWDEKSTEVRVRNYYFSVVYDAQNIKFHVAGGTRIFGGCGSSTLLTHQSTKNRKTQLV